MKKIVNTFVLACILFIYWGEKPLFAQYNRRHFQADYDAKTTKFGYFLGLPSTNYKVKFNSYFLNKDNYYSITSKPLFGLKMGGLVNFKLNDYFDFRVLPTVAIYERSLRYSFINGTTQKDSTYTQSKGASAWFELPIMFKYKSERRGNIRMYVFGGARLGLETNAINRRAKKLFTTKNSDLSIEYGTGIEFFREYFKFAPEIHFSHGFVNLVDPVSNFNTPLAGVGRMTSHTVTLYLIFE